MFSGRAELRRKRFFWNTLTALGYQIISIICGFVLPKLIIVYYGSEINGLVNSITQFLQIISFLEFGVGAVVQSALYKPLADNDYDKISQIIVSAERFFRKIAKILGGYIIILIIIYPHIAKRTYSWAYTSILIVAISISFLAQYYCGIVDQLLLNASQRGYVQYSIQIVTIIFNTLICVCLMKMGQSIHTIKFVTVLIYLLRPLAYRLYIKKYYNINREIKYDKEPIPQKWNGIAQHVSSVILTSTDTVVLTLFSTLKNVSIYSVYYLVISGIQQAFTSLNSGFHALIGELWAKQEISELQKVFGMMEWCIHTVTVFVFGCTSVLFVPFVSIYTAGIEDAEYIQPIFALILTSAYAAKCMSIPYHAMILAAGHYKQTQRQFVITTMLNVVVSILTVDMWGLVGVAIGTFIAMSYQTIWMSRYIVKNLNKWPAYNVLKQLLVDIITAIIGYYISSNIEFVANNYLAWILRALEIVIIWSGVILAINLLVYKEKIKNILGRFLIQIRDD